MESNSRYRKLFEPGRIGSMELKNRIIEAAMGTSLEREDGFVDDRIKSFYVERAKGGVALVTMGVGAVDHPDGKVLPGQLGLSDDKFVPGLKELADAIHEHGAKVAIQLQRGGKLSTEDMARGCQPKSSSCSAIPVQEAMQDMASVEIPRMMAHYAQMPAKLETVELTVDEIRDIVNKFGEAARRAKNAGIDGVEIHAGHGYLLSEFLSGFCNKRTDEYGGNLENRARIVLEVIAAVRDKVGRDYPVWIRIDGKEFGIEGGITLSESKEFARMFAGAGVDAINVSGYGGIRGGFYDAPLCYPRGNLVSLATGIKKAVDIPVIAVGRIDAALGEKLLRQGKADFIAMARAVLADPEYAKKIAEGREDDIRPCIMCYHCVSQAFWGEPVFCSVNAAAGREAELKVEPTDNPKKVLVIGGGPAGMEAARVAALRGHQVTLCEKGRRLGGSLFFASVANADNEGFMNYLIRQMKKLSVETRLKTEVTQDLIDEVKPDAIVVATGGSIRIPEVPGSGRHNVVTGKDLRLFMSGNARKFDWWWKGGMFIASRILPFLLKVRLIRWFTKVWMPMGEKVAIVGGDIVACELAEFLVERKRKVTILEEGTDLAVEMSIGRRWSFMQHLRDAGVTMLRNVDFKEITPRGISIVDGEGKEQFVEANTIIIAGGMEPNTEVMDMLSGKAPQVINVGDCAALRLIHGSVEDGYRAALSI